MKDVTQEELSAIVQFIYNGEVSIEEDKLTGFLQAADALGIRGLTENKEGIEKIKMMETKEKKKDVKVKKGTPEYIEEDTKEGLGEEEDEETVDDPAGAGEQDEEVDGRGPAAGGGEDSPLIDKDADNNNETTKNQDQFEGFYEMVDAEVDVKEAVNQKMIKDGGFWTCKDCSHKVAYKGNMFDHVEANHIEHGGYKCVLCDKVQKTFHTLSDHLNKHLHSSSYSNNNEDRQAKDHCKVLDPSLSIQAIKKAVSQKVVQDGSSYSCKDCGYKNAQKGSVVSHAEIHLDHRGYQCTLCGKSQKTWKAFSVHFNRFHS